MSDTIKYFSQSIQLIKTTETIVNHRPTISEATSTIRAVVQPATSEDILKNRLDYSLKYIQVHSLDNIQVNDIIEYKSIRYKAYKSSDYSDYEYYENILEEIK